MEEDLDIYTPASSLVSSRTYSTTIYDLYLDEDIGEPSRYRDLISTLDYASQGDVVRLHFNTIGGRTDTASAIRRAILNSPAKVVGIVDGCVISAGTMIMTACDDVVFGDLSWGQFHTVSWGTSGDSNKMQSFNEFSQNHIYKMLLSVYTGFLTEEEIDDMFYNSREIYMDAEELRVRWDNFVEYWNQAVDNEEEEV